MQLSIIAPVNFNYVIFALAELLYSETRYSSCT